MSPVSDPVCGMSVETTSATSTSEHDGRTYYFCSEGCKRAFDAGPDKYREEEAEKREAIKKEASGTRGAAGLERHEPPRTTTGKSFTAPKFGSAGSGGAELELLPEAHDRKE